MPTKPVNFIDADLGLMGIAALNPSYETVNTGNALLGSIILFLLAWLASAHACVRKAAGTSIVPVATYAVAPPTPTEINLPCRLSATA